MIFGFSSMGQPELSLEQCADLAKKFALDFLELRVLENTLDLPAYFQSKEIPSVSVPVRILGSSLRLADAQESDLAEFFQFAELAQRLKVPYIRVFGSKGREGDEVSFEKFQKAASVVNLIRERARENGWSFEILMETHSAFSLPEYSQKLNELLPEPLCLIWDSYHTWKFTGEQPAETWAKIGDWVRHVHYKDSRMVGETPQYVLPGEGEFPTSALFDLLRERRYEAGVSLEWEKLWHKELQPLEEALEKFAQVISSRI